MIFLHHFITLSLSMLHMIFVYKVPITSLEDVLLYPKVSPFVKEVFPYCKTTMLEQANSISCMPQAVQFSAC